MIALDHTLDIGSDGWGQAGVALPGDRDLADDGPDLDARLIDRPVASRTAPTTALVASLYALGDEAVAATQHTDQNHVVSPDLVSRRHGFSLNGLPQRRAPS